MNTYRQIYKYTFASYTRNINICVKRFSKQVDICYVLEIHLLVCRNHFLVLVFICAVYLSYTVLGIGVESPDHINSVQTLFQDVLGEFNGGIKRQTGVCVTSYRAILSLQVWIVVSVVVELVLVKVGDFVDGSWLFSKRVVNQLVESQVSTGVGIFIGRATTSQQRYSGFGKKLENHCENSSLWGVLCT